MDTVEIVLAKMKELNAPVNATALANETGLDKKEVDKAMAILKKEEKIFSPVRCKWQAK
ncbi:MAG: transcriptional regulator [Bacteroidaceae bacterium]|nr:transcriptional regulator [Bacteroidaceae bacterium]